MGSFHLFRSSCRTLTFCGGGFFCSSSKCCISRKISPIRSWLPKSLQITWKSFSVCPFSTKASDNFCSSIFGFSWSWSLWTCSYLRFKCLVLTVQAASAFRFSKHLNCFPGPWPATRRPSPGLRGLSSVGWAGGCYRPLLEKLGFRL